MKFTFEVDCTGTEKRVCYQHPVYSNYGLALSVADDRKSVTCCIVFGSIDDTGSKLDIVSDLAAPVDVFVWAFTCIQTIQNTVNGESVDVENLISANKYFYQEKSK